MKNAPAAIGAIALSVGLAACGGSSGSATTAKTSGPPGFAQISDTQRQCLQKQGVAPPGGPGQGGVRTFNGPPPSQGGQGGPPPGVVRQLGTGPRQMPAKLRQAFQKCGIKPPQANIHGPDVNSAAFRSSLTAYVQCVRQNGYALPDPNVSGKGPIFDPSKVNRNDPKFQAASQKCQSKLQPATGAPAPPGSSG